MQMTFAESLISKDLQFLCVAGIHSLIPLVDVLTFGGAVRGRAEMQYCRGKTMFRFHSSDLDVY